MELGRLFRRNIGCVILLRVNAFVGVGHSGGVDVRLDLPHGRALLPIDLAEHLPHDTSVGALGANSGLGWPIIRRHDVGAVRRDVRQRGGMPELRGQRQHREFGGLRRLWQRRRDWTLEGPPTRPIRTPLNNCCARPPELGNHVG